VRSNIRTFQGSLEHWIVGTHMVDFKAIGLGVRCALYIKNLLCGIHCLLNNTAFDIFIFNTFYTVFDKLYSDYVKRMRLLSQV
jgi:hypothetical protein